MKKQLLLFCLTILPLFVYAESGKCGDNVTYDFNATTHILTISGEGPMYDYNTNNKSPFDTNRNIYEVIINPGVTAIGDKAFWCCSSMTSVTIPNSVVRIGKAAFISCLKLETVDIPNSVVEIGSQAFQGCNSMTSVTLSNNISIIEDFTFAKCASLTTISIPNNVTQIKKRVFEDCVGLTEISIPPSVQSIELRAFDNCSSLNSVHITDLESWCNIEFVLGNSVSSNPLNYAHHLYLNSNEVTHLVIPSGIGSIGLGAFEGCTGLKTVEIPNSVISIGGYAFQGCSGITSVNIPTSVKIIDGCAFANCTSLESIEIPSSVVSIGGSAFAGCTSLSSAILSNGISQLGQGEFSACSNLTFATFPNTITDLSEWVFSSTSENLNLYCYSEDVPLVHENPLGGNSDIFGRNNIDGTLYVPKISINDYSESDKWNIFTNIEALPELNYMVDGVLYKSSTPMVCTPIPTEPAPTKEGYTFSGWSETPEKMPVSDVTVTGEFTINKYKLTYYVDDVEYKSYEIEYNSSITPEAAPTKEGYTFSGWSEIPEKMPAKDVSVSGSFIDSKHKLIYQVDGTEYKSYELEAGSSITPEAAPTKEGYTFSGWDEVPETMPDKDVTVSGTFSINKYKLIYKVDGVEYKNYDVEYGTSITPETEPTMEGFTFSGWGEIPETMPAKDVMITGTFTKGAFKLTYMLDGQTYKTLNYDYGDDITPEEAPTREGYTFSGWSEIPATMPAKDVTIIGTFSADKYHLIYKVDGEEYKNYEVEYQAVITPEEAPTREHYTFSGWSEIPETMPANDVIITGTFSGDKYHLIYKVDGEEYKNLNVEYGATITPETEPTKEGYTFSGWSNNIPETMPAKDVTITGTFSINKYKLTYYLDGTVYQTSEVKYGTALTPISDPYVGLNYTFSGWSEIPEKMPAHDVDITGTKVPKKYTLEYQLRDPISGTYSTYKTMEVAYGANITPEPAPTKEGYTFNGWTNIPATMPSYKVTVSGSFTVNSYTLTYQINGETYKSYKQKYGSAITPETAPTKDGFTFSGWGDIPATMPARDVTVNGSYTKNPTTNVTYPAEWDMTGWSEETISNLESDTKWYKSEYLYSYQGSCPKDESIELTANGVKIKETAGVEFAVSNCTMFIISTKEGGLYNVNIEVYESSNFFFVMKNMKRGQKVSIDFKSVDWYSSYDLFPQPVGAVKMTDRATTRAQRTESSVADYIVSADGDVRFNVNADKFFYLYNIDVTEVSEANLTYLANPDGINNQIDCYLYWNGQTSSAIGPWGSNYARGAGVRIVNNSSQTMTITKIEMYEENTNIGTITDQNGDLAPGKLKDFTFSVSSTSNMPSTLPWMEIHYTVNGIPYTKKFESNGDAPTGIKGHRVDGEDSDHEDIYTMDGRKLGSYPTQKGIYIKNGKKFVVK